MEKAPCRTHINLDGRRLRPRIISPADIATDATGHAIRITHPRHMFPHQGGHHPSRSIQPGYAMTDNGAAFPGLSLAKALNQAKQPTSLLEYALDQHAIVSITDAAGNITYANDKFCQISGYSRDELLGNNHRIIKSNAHAPAFFEHLWQTITAGKTWQGLIQNRRKDGNPYWVQSTIVPILDNDGLPQGYISIRTDVTDREITRREYRKFQHALDQTLDCVFMFDAQTLSFIYVNQGAALQVGYERDKLIGMTPFDLNPDWDETAFRSMLKPLIEGKKKKIIFEARQKKSDGSYIPVEIFLQFIPEKQGAGRFIAIVRDISERQRINQALQKLSTADPQQNIFFQLTQTLGEALKVRWAGISHVNTNGRAQVLGFYREGKTGRYFEYPVDDSPCSDILRHQQALTIEYDVALRYPNSRLLRHVKNPVSYRGEPLAASNGQITGVLWVIDDKPRPDAKSERALLQVAARRAALELQRKHDISRLHQTNKELDELVRALRALSEVNQLIVHAHDEQQLLKDICRVIVKETGYLMAWIGYKQDDEAKSITVAACAGHEADYLQQLQLSWDTAAAGQDPASICIREKRVIICHDICNDPQSTPWRGLALAQGYASSIALPLQHDGEIIGVLNLYAGTTDAFPDKEVRLLTEMADDLAFGIAHLRAAKEKKRLERQLRQGQKMEALGQLTSGVAHDFNNILASIMGYTDLALQLIGDSNATLKRYLNEVYSAGERARDIIAQMLSFGRDQSLAEPGDEIIDPVPIIQETLSMLRASLPTSLELKLQLHEPGASLVRIEPSALQQVVMNLLINARDAMNGKGQVLIRMPAPDANGVNNDCDSCGRAFSGNYIELQVIDQGHGMTQETLRHIFDPFFTTKAVDQGTGMGLSVVHGVVHKAGGHILVDSRPGEGTAFRIFLPTAEAAAQAIHGEPLLATTSDALPPTRVLIIDDEASVLGFLQEWLENQGMRVTAFQDSTRALDHFSDNRQSFDIVITDQTMPLLTGLELTKAIRDLRPDIPIIIMSGYNEVVDETVEKKLNIGFIEKPFTPQSLLELLQKNIRG